MGRRGEEGLLELLLMQHTQFMDEDSDEASGADRGSALGEEEEDDGQTSSSELGEEDDGQTSSDGEPVQSQGVRLSEAGSHRLVELYDEADVVANGPPGENLEECSSPSLGEVCSTESNCQPAAPLSESEQQAQGNKECTAPGGDFFYAPATASAPVTSHFDALLECLDLIRSMEHDESVDKQDVIDSLRSMLNNMLSTVMMHSFSTSMSVKGWSVE